MYDNEYVRNADCLKSDRPKRTNGCETKRVPPRMNFHIHTDASDGRNSVEEVVRALKSANVEYFSVTDHNTVAAIKKAKRLAGNYGMGFITGAELTARVPSGFGAHYYAHVLGYGFDEDCLEQPLANEKCARIEALTALLKRLQRGGYAVFLGKSEEELPLLWSTAVFAEELIKKGFARSESEAYRILDTFGGEEVPDFLSVPETVRRIRDAGGIAVWAHPFDMIGQVKKRLEETEVLSIFHEVFSEADGIEVYYQDFTETQIRFLERLSCGTIKSVGTDFHAFAESADARNGRNMLCFCKKNVTPATDLLRLIKNR